MSKPIVTNLGLFTPSGHAWLVSDGEFPFEDCDNRTTSPEKLTAVRQDWAHRQAVFTQADTQRAALGMTWAQYYGLP